MSSTSTTHTAGNGCNYQGPPDPVKKAEAKALHTRKRNAIKNANRAARRLALGLDSSDIQVDPSQVSNDGK